MGAPVALRAGFVAGAHLIEAAYDAWGEAGETNEQVRTSILAGLPGVTLLLHPKTPADALKYFKEGNFLGGGAAGVSFLGKYLGTGSIVQVWQASRKQGRLNKQSDKPQAHSRRGGTGRPAHKTASAKEGALPQKAWEQQVENMQGRTP